MLLVRRRHISPNLSLARESRANQSTVPPSSAFPPRAYCDCTFVRSFRAFLRLHQVLVYTRAGDSLDLPGTIETVGS